MTTRTMPMDPHDTDAKLSLQQRQQLSALLDGDLAPDQARFLLRRLGHDPDLAGCWQRWHLVGDVLRGQPVTAVTGGDGAFAAGVVRAAAREGAPAAAARGRRWQHGIALAAAASVAAVALFVTRPLSVDDGARVPVAATQPPAVPGPPAAPQAEPLREVLVPQFADAAPAPPPSADVARDPVRIASAPAVVPVPQADPPGGAPGAADAPAPVLVLASDGAPFASPAEPQARPWPRAPLTQPETGGVLTVGFGDAGPAPSFYPFEPQLPLRAGAPDGDAAADDTERSP